MPFTDHGSEQPVPSYDNLRAVDWTRLLAEKSQMLDHLFLESIQPIVDARRKLLAVVVQPVVRPARSVERIFLQHYSRGARAALDLGLCFAICV